MLSVFVGGGAMGLLFNAIGANAYMELPFYYHFLMGGFAFGAVFMATDPVTAAQTNSGKWIYGLLIGAFAVLLLILLYTFLPGGKRELRAQVPGALLTAAVWIIFTEVFSRVMPIFWKSSME
jgi:Na+-transporting NADH:ubiquinone oxidoreductase subunit NqrB